MVITNQSQYFENKRIIVTGGNGFIGSNLSRNLINLGARVYSFVRETSDLWRLRDFENKLNIVALDLQNEQAVHKVIRTIKPNHIFHLAIPSHTGLLGSDSLHQQIKVTSENLRNILNSVIGQSYFGGLIHACSSAIYEWKEDQFTLSEKSILAPRTLRGQLKLNERNICLHYVKKHHIPIKLARIFRAYGPWENHQKLIGKAIRSALSNEPISLGYDQYKRDYIYIDDLVDGMLTFAARPTPNGTEVNFGSGKDLSPGEIVNLIGGILELDVPRSSVHYKKNKFDQGRYVADITKASRLLNWQPKISLERGLTNTINWHKQYYQWR